MAFAYDAVLIVSFGGPERADDVLPFLENVTRGRNVPRARLLKVAQHYYRLGGASPINAQNCALASALEGELDSQGFRLPVYLGNRNWHPLLADVVGKMAADGVRRAVAFVTSAFGSYSSCRQYLDDIERARSEVGLDAPRIDKLRLFYNHPGFIEPMIERTEAALAELPQASRSAARLVFTAHSIPLAMAAGGPYEAQLREAARLISDGVRRGEWILAYQSRSGPPDQPWLETDIADLLARLHREGVREVVVVPLGFLSDHMDVLYYLDVEAR
jgi:ferrochelatase